MPASKVQPVRRLPTMQELNAQVDQHNEDANPVLEIGNGQKLTFLKFSRIRPFVGHPFRLYTGERLTDMIDSISRNGKRRVVYVSQTITNRWTAFTVCRNSYTAAVQKYLR